MTAVSFFLLDLPPSKNDLRKQITNKRTGKRGIARTDRYSSWLKTFGQEVMVQRVQNKVHGPFKLRAGAVRPDKSRLDLVNILEALCDGMQAYHVVDNDVFCEDFHVMWVPKMCFHTKRGISVHVEEMKPL